MIVVPKDAKVEFSMAGVPLETPFGVMDGCTYQIRTGGRTYHQLPGPGVGDAVMVLDVETGDIDLLRLEEPFL
jgi:hypothetical protein